MRETSVFIFLHVTKLCLTFLAGYTNYARYGMCYLKTMEILSEHMLDLLLKG